MNRAEAATLLAITASFDRRTVGDADVIAWAAALELFPFAECRDAVVEHYTNSTEWLMPAHVTAIVRAHRALAPATTWCGECDQRTRLLEDPETRRPLGRCPQCHPLSRKART